MSAEAHLEKRTLPFAVKHAQDVGKWSKSKVPTCTQLAHSWAGGNVERAWPSHAPLLSFIMLVTRGLGRSLCGGETEVGKRQTDMPCRESLDKEFI